MPCTDGRPDHSTERQQIKIDRLTRMLCELLKFLEVPHNIKPDPDSELGQWWRNHQLKDEERNG